MYARNAATLRCIKLLTIISYVMLVIVNILAGTGKIGHGSNSDISRKYATYFTPAGYAFSIWSVIFTLQGIYSIYILLPHREDEKAVYVEALSVYLPIVWTFQNLWSVAFAFEVIPLSLFFMICVLVTLGVIYYRINQVPFNVLRTMIHGQHSPLAVQQSFTHKTMTNSVQSNFWCTFDYAIAYVPTAMNFGWITVASIANLSIVFTYEHSPITPVTAAVFAVVAATLGLTMLAIYKDVVYPLVIVWALVALAARDFPIVTVASLTSAALLFVATLFVGGAAMYYSYSGKRGFLSEYESFYRKQAGEYTPAPQSV